MSIPDVSKLQRMVVQSYEPEGTNIDEWQLYKNTPTLKFYTANKTLVIAIRGTFDSKDVAADGLIALGSLERSDRWKNDLPIIQQVISEFKPEHVYAVGHSLGGALLDLLLHKNIVEKGVSYNPAVQPQDILKTLPNRRIYMSDDPLYLLIGRFLKQKPEVRPSKASWFQTLARISPAGNILTAKGYLDAHGLDSFKGGMSGGGYFKDEAKKIYEEEIKGYDLDKSLKRESENILQRATYKLAQMPKVGFHEYRNRYEIAKVIEKLTEDLDEITREPHNTYQEHNIAILNKVIKQLYVALNNWDKKERILNDLRRQLRLFFTGSDETRIRKVPRGAETAFLADVEHGMVMTDLDKMFYKENPKYFSKEELRQANENRVRASNLRNPPRLINPLTNAEPHTAEDYVAQIGPVPPEIPDELPKLPTLPPLKTTRKFGPITKYVLNPIKHLFVPPIEEDFVQHDYSVVEQTNPLYGQGRCKKCGLINSQVFKKKHNVPVSESLTIKEIAKLSGMPVKALNEVYDKGMGAYYSNPASVKPMVKSPEQWAMGRVYSFAMKRKPTFGKSDKSIAEKYGLV